MSFLILLNKEFSIRHFFAVKSASEKSLSPNNILNASILDLPNNENAEA